MRVVVEWTETIRRRSVVEAESIAAVRRLIAEYDDEIVGEIEAVSVEVDGGGFGFDAVASAVVEAER